MKQVTVTDIRPVEHTTQSHYKRYGVYQGRAKEIEVLDLVNGGEAYIVRHMHYEYTDSDCGCIDRETILESRLYDDETEAYNNLHSKGNLVRGYKEYDWEFKKR